MLLFYPYFAIYDDAYAPNIDLQLRELVNF